MLEQTNLNLCGGWRDVDMVENKAFKYNVSGVNERVSNGDETAAVL